MPLTERAARWPEILTWHPASGHPSGRWRIVREALPPEPALIELCGTGGSRILFRSRAAAELRCKALNLKGSRIMAKIIVNAITHRQACLGGASTADDSAYDGGIDTFMVRLGAAARARGIEFEVDAHGAGAASYRVTDEAGPADYEAAHEFMQSPTADFWTQF